jgi:hypothetical protein
LRKHKVSQRTSNQKHSSKCEGTSFRLCFLKQAEDASFNLSTLVWNGIRVLEKGLSTLPVIICNRSLHFEPETRMRQQKCAVVLAIPLEMLGFWDIGSCLSSLLCGSPELCRKWCYRKTYFALSVLSLKLSGSLRDWEMSLRVAGLTRPKRLFEEAETNRDSPIKRHKQHSPCGGSHFISEAFLQVSPSALSILLSLFPHMESQVSLIASCAWFTVTWNAISLHRLWYLC